MSATPANAVPLGATEILDGLPHGVVLFESSAPTPHVVYANTALRALTGYMIEELRARPLWQLLAGPESDPLAQHQVRSACAGVAVAPVEWLAYRKDGATFWVRVTCCGKERDAYVVSFENISDYKRARESLRTSEGRLEVAMAAKGLSMWDWNVARDEIYYNEHWRESLAIDPEALLDRKELHERLLLPADQPEVLRTFEDHYGGRTPSFSSEYRLATASGEQRWFEAYARVVRRDAEGRPLRMIGVLSDVTHERNAVAEMTAVQERWERAVRGTCDGLYDWDLASGHVWYAERFREIVGYSHEEFPDTFASFRGTLHPDDVSLVMSKIRAHLENHAKLDVRCRVRTRAGKTIWCRLRGETIRDAAGRPLRLSGSISDITAQVEAEEALVRSQDFYGTILDSLPVFIAYLDQCERIVYANRGFCEFFGAMLADERGRPLKDVIGPRRYGAIRTHLRTALGGCMAEAQGRLRAESGPVIELDAVFQPHYDEHGELRGCIIAARDVTDKRQLEAELRQSQKMEAVGRLTGGIAHDFNNLLSVIIGNLQLLGRALRESSRQYRQVDTALGAAMRGAALTRRLLAFSRQQVLEPKIVDLNVMIAEMFELVRRTLTSDIEIDQSLAPQIWPIRVDPNQLESAVLNLVINARDAMPKGGAIMLRTRNVTIDAQHATNEEGIAPGEYAVIEVEDTGVGMSEEVQKRAFEPFFTTKDVGKGSGLGLSMVYGFVTQSGGHVRLRSVPNQGTTVYLYFPRVEAALVSSTAEAGASAELPQGNELILIVEDTAEVRRTAVDILTTLGYRALEAATGHQALQQFMQHPDIALVFSDVMLPGGLLGCELVEKLRERRPDLRILMTSGFNDSGIMQRGLLDGSIEFLQKPYKVEDLARRVRVLLDG